MLRVTAIATAIAATLATTMLSSCQETVSGPTTMVQRPVSGFTRLAIHDGFNVVLKLDSTEGLSIEAPSGAMPHIVSEVVNGELRVYVDNAISGSFQPRRLEIRARRLDGIELSGGTVLVANGTFEAATFSMEQSGGSEMDIAVKANRVELSSSGGSELRVAGAADVFHAGISGGGTVDAFALPTRQVEIHASGGSVLKVSASERLTVEASGGSEIYYKGSPEVTSSLSGGSVVTKVD